MNNRILIPVLIFPLVVALIVGLFFVFRADDNVEPKDPDATDNGTIVDPEDIQHTTGNPVIEFDEGNEAYLDESIVSYLERMDQGVPSIDENGNYYLYEDGDVVYDYSGEKKLEAVLDNVILLINHFVKENYSMEAIHQIQRFYIEYHESLEGVSFEELSAKIGKCFSVEGADPETLNQTVIEVFGYNRGDECAFVFTPMIVAPIKVEFYNVLPKEVELTESMELLCIYDSWMNEEDDGYERNLENWLHNIIYVAREAGISDEKIVVAQILYAGSIADAEYRSDWESALIECLTIDDWTFESLKKAVEREFGVSLDYIINPLEPKEWSDTSEGSTVNDEEDTFSDSDAGTACPEAFRKATRLSQHISYLKDFFRVYKDFNDAQIDALEILLTRLYGKFGIHDNTDYDKLKAEDYPIMADLYEIVENEYMKYEKGSKSLFTEDLLRELCLGLNSMCVGAESKFFNGHTNISDDKFICFGVKGLMEANKKFKDAMLFNILSYMNHKLLTKGHTSASIDELYLFLTNLTAIEYIRNASKRVRKKESSIILASQNIEDFLLPEIKEFTKPLFSIPTHQFLFNGGNINARDYIDALQLEESEFDLIKYPERGTCLFKCGNERYLLQVKAPDYKAKLFGEAGGR